MKTRFQYSVLRRSIDGSTPSFTPSEINDSAYDLLKATRGIGFESGEHVATLCWVCYDGWYGDAAPSPLPLAGGWHDDGLATPGNLPTVFGGGGLSKQILAPAAGHTIGFRRFGERLPFRLLVRVKKYISGVFDSDVATYDLSITSAQWDTPTFVIPTDATTGSPDFFPVTYKAWAVEFLIPRN